MTITFMSRNCKGGVNLLCSSCSLDNTYPFVLPHRPHPPSAVNSKSSGWNFGAITTGYLISKLNRIEQPEYRLDFRSKLLTFILFPSCNISITLLLWKWLGISILAYLWVWDSVCFEGLRYPVFVP